MHWWLMAHLAVAAPVEGGFQVTVFEDGLDFVEDLVAGQTFVVARDDVGAQVGCWDRLGVRDLELDIPVQTVAIDPGSGAFTIDVTFGDIVGEDITIYTQDSNVDACPNDFQYTLEQLVITDAFISVAVEPGAEDGRLMLELASDPILSFHIETTLSEALEETMVAFLEEKVNDAISAETAGPLLDTVSGFLDAWLVDRQIADWTFDVAIDDAESRSGEIWLASSVDVQWTGPLGCARETVQADVGLNPTLQVGYSTSSLAIGVTEALLNEQLLAAWHDGYACFNEQDIARFVDLVASAFDPTVVDMRGSVELLRPPQLRFAPEGATLLQDDITLTITAVHEGERVTLFDARGDIEGTVDLAMDPSLGSVTLSVVDLELDFDHVEAELLLSEEASAADNLAGFLEGFVVSFLADKLQDVQLFQSSYAVYGIVWGMDDVDFQNGGVVAHLSLYHQDDPRVDLLAPDTQVQVEEVVNGVIAEISGTDDREGPLEFAWSVNDGPWSVWSTDGDVLVELPPGEHTLSFASRDSWYNVDASPVVVQVSVSGLQTAESSGCGCRHAPPCGPWILLLPLLGLRRRGACLGAARS